jgi:multisubunit Na+/H+ antiporter MnhC subunit
VHVTLINVMVLALFVVGGGLVALMVTITQRSYKKDEQSEHWVIYPTAKGERPIRPVTAEED